MSEQVASKESAAVAAPPPVFAQKPKKGQAKKKLKKFLKTVVVLLVIAALLGGGGYFLYRFLNTDDTEIGEIYAMPAEIGSITSSASGSGSARAKESTAITLTASGTVQEVFVTSGDIVFQGQPLYTINSQEAQDRVDQLAQEMEALREEAAGLTITAPFAGKLMNVHQFQIDDQVVKGQPIATLVNDRVMRLSLYYSYAYEDSIYVGQPVSVSVPAVMNFFDGRVERINKVSRVTPEGSILFQVIVTFPNPGTLTEDMAAGAMITAANGTEIYPYEDGRTEFYESRTIMSRADGPVIAVGNMLDYGDVDAGQLLVGLGSDVIDQQLQEKQLAYDEAVANLSKFDAVAPIDGTVISCTLSEGAEVRAGDTVIIISNNTTMLVDITVDDRNIAFVRPGSFVELSDWSGGSYMGEVTSINMGGAQMGQGMTSYPVTLTVDNWSGSLMEGAWLQYSFITSQSDDCILVPSGAVRYFNDMDGNRQSVVFVQREERPDDVPELDLPERDPYDPKYPTEEEGYYPVIVETGLADTKHCEIVSGIEVGDMVFVAYTVTSSAWG